MKTLTAVLALALCLPAFADDQSTSGAAGKAMDRAKKSDTTKNFGAKALAKIGMDYTPSPQGAKVYIISPANGAEVSSPVKVVFGLSGMGIAPAGTQAENTGHHHLLIDNPTVDMNAALPKTDQVMHFGGGQTEGSVTLKPGKHTLQLVLGDYKHQPHSPPVTSETITITVK